MTDSTTKYSEPAPAKVNLFLHVLGRRPDGYHLLDSLAVFTEYGDRLYASESDGLSLAVTGPFAAGLADEADNLVLRAARRLASVAGIIPRARLTLEKNLPVASGIGGGSADAAAALRLLCRLWCLPIDMAALLPVASPLGADVPVCLASRTTRMSGVGEQLRSPPGLPECGLVLVNPGVALSTAEVFSMRQAPFSAAAMLPTAWADAAQMAVGLRALSNDLEPPALRLRPVIGDVLRRLRADPDCLLARMSGSGATCFGLYRSAAAAERAAAAQSGPGWWSWGGGLRRE